MTDTFAALDEMVKQLNKRGSQERPRMMWIGLGFLMTLLEHYNGRAYSAQEAHDWAMASPRCTCGGGMYILYDHIEPGDHSEIAAP